MFDRKTFGFTFTIAIAISLFVAVDSFTGNNLLLTVFAALLTSLVVAALTACHRYPRGWFLSKCRAVMVMIAKKTVRYSLLHAMASFECSGIFEREGGVAVKVQVGQIQGITAGSQLNVYESTGNSLWGIVDVVDVRDFDCDCIPYDRANTFFWEELEHRVKFDTSAPPNVYFVRKIRASEIIDTVEELLDKWR